MSNYRQTHRSFYNHTHRHQQQQRSYNQRNVPRHPNYQSSRRHHNVHNILRANYSSFRGNASYVAADHHENFSPQFQDQYQNPVFQSPMLSIYSVDIVLPSVVDSPNRLISDNPVSYYEQIDDDDVATDLRELMESNEDMRDYINYMTSQLTELERNPRVLNVLNDLISYVLDIMDDLIRNYEEDEGEDEDEDVLQYLKIRTHYAPVKDGGDPEIVVVDDAESSECAICQSDYEHEDNIGTLQCGHEYHVSCIQKWLLKKKDCPMCRASV